MPRDASIFCASPAAVEAARSYFLAQLGCVTERLREHPSLLEAPPAIADCKRFTAADLLLTSVLVWAEVARSQVKSRRGQQGRKRVRPDLRVAEA